MKRTKLSFRLYPVYHIMILIFTAVFTAATPRSTLAQTTLVVDGDGQASAADCDAVQGAFSSIQDAVDAAIPGDTVFICPGTFDEQVAVTTSNITLQGSGMDTTIIRPSEVHLNSTGTITPFPVAAILLVSEATGVSVKGLTIDGGLADGGAANPNCLDVGFYGGIYYRNSSGTVNATHITNIRSATVCSSGLSLSSNFEHVSNLWVNGNVFDNYGGEGMRCGGPYVTCRIIGNIFRGQGPIDDQIQGGIIMRGGAGGEISGNTILDHYYAPAVGIYEFAVGIALFNAEPTLQPHLLQENTFSGNQLDVQRQGTAQTFE